MRATAPGTVGASLADIAVGPTGPVVVWEEAGSGVPLVLRVARWDRSTWNALGGAITRGTSSADWPAIALEADGTPVIAWQQDDAGAPTRIYAARWDGSTWAPLGGPISGPMQAEQPSIAIGSDGRALVAWHEVTATSIDGHVSRWDGAAWVPMGAALDALPGVTWARTVRVTGGATPYVAWFEGVNLGTFRVYVRRWDGAAWQPVGDAVAALPDPSEATFPALAVDATGPVLAWNENPEPVTRTDVYAARFDGSTWSALGASSLSASIGGGVTPDLALDAEGNALVVWRAVMPDALRVHRFRAGAWEELGPLTLAGTVPAEPAIGVDRCGVPYVVDDEVVGGVREVHVYAYRAP